MTSHFRTAPTAMAALAVAAVAAFAVAPVHASFSLGDAANFAVYGSGSTTTSQFSPGPLTINGNVGVGAGGDVSLAGGQNVVITGQIFYSVPITTANFGPTTHDGIVSIYGKDLDIKGSTEATDIADGIAAGQLVHPSPEASKAAADLASLYTAVEGLAATGGAPSGSLTGDKTWTGTSGIDNVAVLDKVDLASGDVLTLTIAPGGNADTTYFVFNIKDDFKMADNAQIVLGNGVLADHVLFNMLKSADGGDASKNVSVNGTSIGFGTILALDRNVTFNSDSGKTSTWTGRIFGDDSGKTISFGQAVVLNQPGFKGLNGNGATPEPASVILLLTAMLAGLGIHRFRSRGVRVAQLPPSIVPA